MATGYASFLKDTENDIAVRNRILDLTPSSNDDDYYYESDGVGKNKQSRGILHVLTEHGTACFNTEDVRDGGCSALFNRGTGTPCTDIVQEEEKGTTLALTNGEKVQVQEVQTRQPLTTTKNTLAAGRKWASGKMKTAFHIVIGKLLKEDGGPAITSNGKSDGVTKNVSSIKEELNNARLLLFFMDKDVNQVPEEKGHDSDDGTVDTEKDSS